MMHHAVLGLRLPLPGTASLQLSYTSQENDLEHDETDLVYMFIVQHVGMLTFPN